METQVLQALEVHLVVVEMVEQTLAVVAVEVATEVLQEYNLLILVV